MAETPTAQKHRKLGDILALPLTMLDTNMVVDANGKEPMSEFTGDDARALLSAINVHDDLLEACRDIESKIVDYEAGRINWRPDDFLFRVRAALLKAEG